MPAICMLRRGLGAGPVVPISGHGRGYPIRSAQTPAAPARSHQLDPMSLAAPLAERSQMLDMCFW